MKEVLGVGKVDNKTIEVEYDDGSVVLSPVIKLESRIKALELCKSYTKQELLKPHAFDRLGTYYPESLYDRLRNYEIENYLDKITGKFGHRINENCPFNGFSWFD